MKVDLTTADFVAALPFSDRIEDSQIRAAITDAYTLDLLPILGHETLEQLTLIDAFTSATYQGPTSLPGIQQNTLIERRERIYQALVASPGTEPPVEATVVQLTANYPVPPVPQQNGEWLFKRLETLWQVYLKPYWLQAAYVRFLLNHGVNVTKAGLTVPIDRTNSTYDRPSSAQVAQLLADARITAEARLSRLTRFLKYEGLLYFYDPATGGGYYGDYEWVPGDPPLTETERARYSPNRRRHKSPFRGI